MTRVLFVCADNGGASQMARALFERAAGPRHSAESAGATCADRVDPAILLAMEEAGIDIAGRSPQSLTRELVEPADVVVRIGCDVEYPPVDARRWVDWRLPASGSLSLDEARGLRDEIERRVSDLVGTLDRSDPGIRLSSHTQVA